MTEHKPDDPAQALSQLSREAAGCRNCPLWEPATQTVFGEGNPRARVLFVGEQPGDQEDLAGKPFVGPAGRLLDRALVDAGIDRKLVYITNAVKHFKFELRGKRRLHKTPAQAEIDACEVWLVQEIGAIAPQLIVALGATAARAVFGRATPIEKNRGHILTLPDGRQAIVTVHPSYLLRIRGEQRQAAYQRFVDDLRLVTQAVAHDRR